MGNTLFQRRSYFTAFQVPGNRKPQAIMGKNARGSNCFVTITTRCSNLDEGGGKTEDAGLRELRGCLKVSRGSPSR